MERGLLIRFLILIIIILITIFFISFVIFQENSYTPEEKFVKDYLKIQNFEGLDKQIINLHLKINYSEGFFKKIWEHELFKKEKIRDFYNKLIEIVNISKKENITSDLDEHYFEQIKIITKQRNDISQKISSPKINTLYKNETYAKINVKYVGYVKDFTGKQSFNVNVSYILNYINDSWKIVDLQDDQGYWSETINITKDREDFLSFFNEQEKIFENFNYSLNFAIKEKNYEQKIADFKSKITKEILWSENFDSGSVWNGLNSEIIELTPKNFAVRITGNLSSNGYLYKNLTIPKNAEFISFYFKNEVIAPMSYLTLSFGNEVLNYESLGAIDAKPNSAVDVFIEHLAGETNQLLFSVYKMGDENPSIIIYNITFYRNVFSGNS